MNIIASLLSLLQLLLLQSVATLVSASKDSDYYSPGFSNPNVEREMYWKDSVNVLQDLSQFSALYIKYHGCVWTKYGSRYGIGYDYDFAENDDEVSDAIDSSNGCGGDGGEYYWYMGRTQCFRANVAFSLYGILVGEDHATKCQKKTYINSFFTTFGVESFGGPMGLAIDEVNSVCLTEKPDGEANYEGADHNDDYLDNDQKFVDYTKYTSQGIGCASTKFVIDSYKGAFCNGNEYVETLDTLDDFNAAIESMECTQIYGGNTNNDNNDGRDLEADNNNFDYNFEEMSPVSLLRFSRACSIRQYPHDCPDPYGLLRTYTSTLERSLNSQPNSNPKALNTFMNVSSGLFLLTGLILMILAFTQFRDTKNTNVSNRRKFNRSIMGAEDDGDGDSPTEDSERPASPRQRQYLDRLGNAVNTAKASVVAAVRPSLSRSASRVSPDDDQVVPSNSGTSQTDAAVTNATGTVPSATTSSATMGQTTPVVMSVNDRYQTTGTSSRRRLGAGFKKFFGNRK